MKYVFLKHACCMVVVSILLIGCGGGGGNDNANNNDPAEAATSVPHTAPTPAVKIQADAATPQPAQVEVEASVSTPPPLATSGSSGNGATASSSDDLPLFEARLNEQQNAAYHDNALVCWVFGQTTLLVEGRNMVNVELLPAEGYEPVYGRFDVSPDGTRATFQLDTVNQFTDGYLPIRISAFDAQLGQPAREIHAMSPRLWRMAHNCKFASEADWAAWAAAGPIPQATLR